MHESKLKIKAAKDIIDYWTCVERFTPPKVETKIISESLKSIQKEVLGAKDIPWENRKRFEHKITPNYTKVYTVFLGVIKFSDIAKQIKELLKNNDDDFGLNGNDLSCLCCFQLNNYGEYIKDTLIIPDYFVSMSCLRLIDNDPKNWIKVAPIIHQKLKDAFDNQCDMMSNRPYRSFSFSDIDELLHDLIEISGVRNLHQLISNRAIVYTSEIPVKNKFFREEDKKKALAKFRDVNYYEEILHDTVAPEYVILNSFFVNDLSSINNKLSVDDIGKSLKEYLQIDYSKDKSDVRSDLYCIRKYCCFPYIPAARWPGDPNHPLSLAQQMAVNIALKSDDGIFSVNGPPGTGKSTLLRDIIAGVIFKRAESLCEFDDPNDAFKTSTPLSLERYNYRVWHLDESLSGYEIVIASTNNTAVENISKEIPRQSEVSNHYNLDYFSEIASFALEEEAWGIGAAVLGNKSNRHSFFEKYWSKTPDEKNNDHKYGLEYLLNNIKPKSDWNEFRNKFLAAKKQFDYLIDELCNFSKAAIEVKNFQEEIAEIKQEKDELITQIRLAKEEIISNSKKLQLLKQSINSKNNQLQSTMALKPAWYIVLVDFFLKGSSYQDWQNKCMALVDEVASLTEELDAIPVQISNLEDIITELDNNLDELDQIETSKQFEYTECLETIDYIKNKHEWFSQVPDEELWKLSDNELQLQSPWIHKELQETRAELFVEAMNLHKSFIINTHQKISNNLRSIKYLLTNSSWPYEYEDLIPHMWSTFFMVVPTVSTTFASFSSLFSNLDPASLGYLLVDEAGQSSPQSAAGAIYRAKRTVIVGDPMQIPPVVTIPQAINRYLLDYYNVSRSWDVLEESVQTLSDRVNGYGTFLGEKDNAIWVGCPLRVHRRCVEPMFTISNSIAYDNLMIQATHYKPSQIEQYISGSKWINIQDGKFDGNWCSDEGAIVLKLLFKIISSTKCLPSLYIISPFKQVASSMKSYVKNNATEFHKLFHASKGANIYSWANKSIGTVHAFQGKQAEAVILLLGGNPNKSGAINWASKYPNILNVAVTRAKNILIVVGNHEIWSNKTYFSELSNKIEVTNQFEDLLKSFLHNTKNKQEQDKKQFELA